MDEVIISKSIVVDFTELSMTMPAITPRLITISIFGFNGNPEMNDSTTDTTIDIVKAHSVPIVKAVRKTFFLLITALPPY